MSTTYYKATRPDGTDFRTGTLAHKAGETISHPRTRRFKGMAPNDPATYLSVSVEPAETLIGGRWPCRLWRVEPVGRVVNRTDGQYPHKRGCVAYRVVEELPAHVALGPNGEQVAALIERAGALTSDEARRLAAAWDAAWDAARGAAGDAARGAAGAAAEAAAWAAAWDAARAAARGAAWAAAWGAARDAAGAAARALVVRDLISVEHFDVLYGPWATVIDAADKTKA